MRGNPFRARSRRGRLMAVAGLAALVGCVHSASELRLRQEAEQSALERARAESTAVVIVPSGTSPATYWKLYLSDSGSAAAAGARRGAGIAGNGIRHGARRPDARRDEPVVQAHQIIEFLLCDPVLPGAELVVELVFSLG